MEHNDSNVQEGTMKEVENGHQESFNENELKIDEINYYF